MQNLFFFTCGRTQYSLEVTAYFPHLQEEDAGDYHCRAHDFSGANDTSVYYLRLKGMGGLDIQCNAYGDPKCWNLLLLEKRLSDSREKICMDAI